MLQRIRGACHDIDEELEAIKASAEETERELEVLKSQSSRNVLSCCVNGGRGGREDVSAMDLISLSGLCLPLALFANLSCPGYTHAHAVGQQKMSASCTMQKTLGRSSQLFFFQT